MNSSTSKFPFPLAASHLELAHDYWRRLLQPGDLAIDATAGNGQDTLFIAKLLVKNGNGLKKQLFAIDIQPKAIAASKKLLEENLPTQMDLIEWITASHEVFPSQITPESVKLIVYNLGYLPGGDKSLTTMLGSTLESIKNALTLLTAGGALSITCYPGHPEGKKEEESLLEFAKTLNPRQWSVLFHRYMNREASPSLLLIVKTAARGDSIK
jgi:SAM-dependent methyltransferase